ncbi:putative ternary complex factor MIP1, leucine-zipper [Helianthus annuus]|nr:putative ternary complex factor MIP1, leucine-zipper [Helianthus annuus]
MKFEELIMQETQQNQKTLALQQEVEQLEEELEEELKLSKVLQYALDGPCCPCLSTQTHLPFKIKELLTELATVEEEIMWLEKKVHKLNLSLYLEKKQTREWELQQLKNLHPRHQRSRTKPHRRQQSRLKFMNNNHELQDFDTQRRRSSFGSSVDFRYTKLGLSVLEVNHNHNHIRNPNKLSEDLIKCLIGIFLDMNQPFPDSEEGSDIAHKQVSCMSSKSFISKTSFNCTAPTFFYNNNGSNFDPYSISLDFDGAVRDIGPYKTFTHITRTTLDHTRISECSTEVGKIRVLMQKLCSAKLSLLTYKQKLAFWINIYNACIMHAFLQHGLPSTQEKQLVLMNKAVINVGGIVVNALAIEHFILRHPSNSNHGLANEREILLRHAYGLGFPEPNVTFALCRGSWSSPALRVYTAEDIVNELARARLEYLDASVGVISKKKIMVPKLLHWHMKDFADDLESLLEWIYSQLPQSGSLKRLIMECLNGETKSNPAKMIEIQPYVYEFRYLLPS